MAASSGSVRTRSREPSVALSVPATGPGGSRNPSLIHHAKKVERLDRIRLRAKGPLSRSTSASLAAMVRRSISASRSFTRGPACVVRWRFTSAKVRGLNAPSLRSRNLATSTPKVSPTRARGANGSRPLPLPQGLAVLHVAPCRASTVSRGVRCSASVVVRRGDSASNKTLHRSGVAHQSLSRLYPKATRSAEVAPQHS